MKLHLQTEHSSWAKHSTYQNQADRLKEGLVMDCEMGVLSPFFH